MTRKITTCKRCQLPFTATERVVRVADYGLHTHCYRAMNAECRALAPETNTEAAQQNAAELEQACPPLCLCQSCIDKAAAAEEAAFAQGEADDAAEYAPHGICTYCGRNPIGLGSDGEPFAWCDECDYNMTHGRPIIKTFQPDMFAARVDDLPLFSGTAPRVADPGRFGPPAARPQPRLF